MGLGLCQGDDDDVDATAAAVAPEDFFGVPCLEDEDMAAAATAELITLDGGGRVRKVRRKPVLSARVTIRTTRGGWQ